LTVVVNYVVLKHIFLEFTKTNFVCYKLELKNTVTSLESSWETTFPQ
jgi:hypothetical protein